MRAVVITPEMERRLGGSEQRRDSVCRVSLSLALRRVLGCTGSWLLHVDERLALG